MNKIRVGIVGIGSMGSYHATNIYEGKIRDAILTAICDVDKKRLKWAKERFENSVEVFENSKDMFKSESIDAVIIATPHYDHPTIAIKAFERNLHVLIEKPAGVYTKKVCEMNEVAQKSEKVFGIMYNQRTNPIYQKLRDIIQSGEMGQIKRVIWVITDWYRTQSYYNSSAWRATWAKEGGGGIIESIPSPDRLVAMGIWDAKTN